MKFVYFLVLCIIFINLYISYSIPLKFRHTRTKNTTLISLSKDNNNKPFDPNNIESNHTIRNIHKQVIAGNDHILNNLPNTTKYISEIIPLKLEDLKPPDHLDAVRLEQDGHINKDYKKEILLGNHEEFENKDKQPLIDQLEKIFLAADTDNDGFLQQSEIVQWIQKNVEEHMSEAEPENENIFKHLDMNRDGFITWKEFHTHFLLAKGINVKNALSEVDIEESENFKKFFGPEDREQIVRFKFRWIEADTNPLDDKLDLEEFMNFRHPEQSSMTIERLSKEIIDKYDRNGDDIVSEREYSLYLPEFGLHRMGDEEENKKNLEDQKDLGDKVEGEGDDEWRKERLKEFRNLIDLNHDGRADLNELKIYIDPRSPIHSVFEAENLIRFADDNEDGKLSLDEVLSNSDYFFGSKLMKVGSNFHDEF